MTSTRPIAVAQAQRADSAGRRVDSDSGPPGSSFDLILERTAQARTAPAEGQTVQTESHKDSVTDEQQAPLGSDAATDASTPTELSVSVAAPSLGTSSTLGEVASASSLPVPLEDGTGAAPGVEAPALLGLSKSEVTAPVLEGAGAVAGLISEETGGASAISAAVDADGAPVAAGVAGQRFAGDTGAGAEPKLTAEPKPAIDPRPAVPVSAESEAQAPAAAPVAEDPFAAQPTATVRIGGAAGTTAAYGANPAVRIQHIQALVDLAISRGSASATLELYPAELGEVNVRLRSGKGGLSATMTVDRPESLAALQAAADDLRRSLEAKGVEIVRLEIGLSAQAREDQARTGARSDGRDRRDGNRRSQAPDATTDHLDHLLADVARVPLNPGALIDVRA